MKSVRVQYTVSASFVATNKSNISKVMDALKMRPVDGLIYFAGILDDGETFVHTVVARNEAAQKQLTDLDEFKAFQVALRESRPVVPPEVVNLNLVGASLEI